jgi:hypothetical protein
MELSQEITNGKVLERLQRMISAMGFAIKRKEVFWLLKRTGWTLEKYNNLQIDQAYIHRFIV